MFEERGADANGIIFQGDEEEEKPGSCHVPSILKREMVM